MNEQSPICLKCPAKRVCEEPQTMPDGITIRTQTCPPQDKAVRLYQKTKGAETSTTQTPNEQLSTIKQDVLGRYHCPNSKKYYLLTY